MKYEEWELPNIHSFHKYFLVKSFQPHTPADIKRKISISKMESERGKHGINNK